LVSWIAINLTNSGQFALNWCNGRSWAWAFEPSWFASQTSVFWFPLAIWFSYSTTVIRHRWIGVCAIAACVIGVSLSGSRAGVAGLSASLGLIGLYWIWMAWRQRNGHYLIPILGCLVAIVVTIGVGLGLNNVGQRTLAMVTWSETSNKIENQEGSSSSTSAQPMQNSIAERLRSVNMGPRAASWSSGWNTFSDYPVMGIGLGLAPWGVVRHWPYDYVAIEEVHIGDNYVRPPNTRHLIVRILAEGGIIAGLLALGFVVWHGLLARKVFGGPILLLAMGPVVFIDWSSLDSFALPPLWLSAGFLAALGTQKSSTSQN
jgi:hypothetical protein